MMPILLLLLSALGIAGGMAISMGPATFLAFIQGEDLPEPEDAPAEEHATNDHGAAQADTGHGGGHGAAPGDEMTVTPFKEMIVNITSTTATGRRTTRFLKLNVALVYDAALPGADDVEARKLYLRDSFQDYLRQLNEADLQGTYGLTTLKTELLRRARAVTGSDAPQELLVSDLIVQ
ncbi:flagellar basal body-associated protein FliL [Pseudooceanicola nanhaiensis]|uniref:flagellar basal body-associated FliL family protein n=1 Tax=Pseudooceanicola nanhaiensis TaxID=375761 RepID=UPI001CD1F010|nr:flagellar basal body-associated FliL family protein [Pseudooceanicola nanhaiensis]MCA0922636.1 flagellar basal body-associated FliL family protein [Pseudooceanicola nanhaiensis]